MPRIEHFALFAEDVQALKSFYEEAFGLRVVLDNSGANPPGYFLADGSGSVLELIGRPPGEAGVNQRYICHVAFWVEDFASARAGLERRGLVFETDTEVNNASMRTAFFRDPQGNRCQIVWRREPLGSA